MRGIIPARAGFTCGRGCGTSGGSDHPRSRGVYATAFPLVHPSVGSSPLARGLRWRSTRPGTGPGIIPARAGFTSSAIHASARPSDHPRSRGVYPTRLISASVNSGSSPLARGLPPRTALTCSALTDHPRSRGVYVAGAVPEEAVSGIIPARAGFTATVRSPSRSKPDHPRSRGVYRGLVCRHGRQRRIIPARAGFTNRSSRSQTPCSDHPRSRGVYRRCIVQDAVANGSSPLARGLPVIVKMHSDGTRIIPARAGFTPVHHPGRRLDRDHPRSRGVYVDWSPSRPRSLGSSPLARGLQEDDP